MKNKSNCLSFSVIFLSFNLKHFIYLTDARKLNYLQEVLRIFDDSRGREETGEDREGGSSGQREPRSTPDWGPNAFNGEHIWVPTATSGDFCYINECSVSPKDTKKAYHEFDWMY